MAQHARRAHSGAERSHAPGRPTGRLLSPRRYPPSLQTLPRLAEVLSSRELLLRCFEAAAEQDEQEA